VLLLRNKDQE